MPSSQDQGGPLGLAPYLLAWRTTPLWDREVIDALVHPAHAAPSPALARALAEWPGDYYWSEEAAGRWLILTRRTRVATERWWLHAALFALTLITTTIAGAVLQGRAELNDAWGLLRGRLSFVGDPAHALLAGTAFSIPLMAILLAHELGHYVTARRYLLEVSPPYFLPVPLWPSFIGTMGAFIRLRTLLADRRQLFDVGVAGPLAGFAVALPTLLLGLHLSVAIPPASGLSGMLLRYSDSEVLRLGDSLVTLLARWAMHGDLGPVVVHPLAFAGVLGMFVTMINLMPMAQLDGGHILYAAIPRWHRRAAFAFWLVVLILGSWWVGWYIWAGLVFAVSRGRLDHPTVLETSRPLPRSRRLMAWGALALFLLTFMPVPFRI